jgi:hypothetical protein
MLYISRKKEHGVRGAEKSGNSCHSLESKTREAVAKETGVSPRTIANDAAYAEACDKLGISTAQFDNAAVVMLCDPSELAVDFRTPLDDLIEAEELEDHDTLDLAGLRGIPVDALRVFVLFLLPSDSKPTSPGYWRQVTKRAAALAYSLGIEEVRKFPLSKIAPAIPCTRAMLSLLCVELRDFASLDHRAGRSDAARETYSTRARQVWNHRAVMKRKKSKESL